MSRRIPSIYDRRAFLRLATMSAAGAGASVAFGGLAEALAALPMGGTPALDGSGADPFEMVVIGDSIMWGQGLRDEQKFSTIVQRWLQARMPGRPVHRHILAHSGARILPHPVEDEKPPTHGEVPNHFPSITKQVAIAASTTLPMHASPNPANVGLVLLDGGINDFGTKIILNLDPTVGRAWVRKQTRIKSVARMRGLLRTTLDTFPNAKVVVTNYFQIVSSASDMVYIWELLRAWEVVGHGVDTMSEWVKQKMVDQSLAFHEEYTTGLRDVVRDAARASTAVATATPRMKRAGGRPAVLDAAPLALPRVALAEIPFGERNSYGAPETLLFYVNEPDPAAAIRKPMCMEQIPVASAELPNCLLAAGGHPNVRGATVYAEAIIDALQRMTPEWRETPKAIPPTVRGPQPAVRRPARPPR